jgi:phage terminase large subunit-like protein
MLAAPLAWAREFLPHYFSAPSCPFHTELMADLQDDQNRRLARVAPRGHAKSTCAALAFPLWCICERKRRNIVVVTHEESLATQFVRDMRLELEENERILAAYGDLCRETAKNLLDTPGRQEPSPHEKQSKRPDKRRAARTRWTDRNFITATDISVRARGSGGSFRGMRIGPHRPDLIICDDLERDDAVHSRERRAKLENWLRRVVMPALAPHGRLLVLGSILHFDSLLAGLADRKRWPGWNYRVYRALEAEAVESAREGEPTKYRMKALWPEVWPTERLDEEQAVIGTSAFQQEYQANPIDESKRAFRPEWLRRTPTEEFDALDQQGRLIKLIAVDPATGKDSGDFFALWVGGVDSVTGLIHSRLLVLERIGIVEQVNLIVDAFQRYRPIRIGVESVAYQAALLQILEERSLTQRMYMPVVPILSRGHKVARIQGSACFFENGTFRLPEDLSPEAEAQFLHFPNGKHDDAPDVCAMAIDLARELRGVTVGIEATTRKNGNPFARDGAW